MIVFHTDNGERWEWELDETGEHWEIVLNARLNRHENYAGWIKARKINHFNNWVGPYMNLMTAKILAWEIA